MLACWAFNQTQSLIIESGFEKIENSVMPFIILDNFHLEKFSTD
jgi:hypothetical protein